MGFSLGKRESKTATNDASLLPSIPRPPSPRPSTVLLGITFLVVFIILLGIGDGAPKVLLAQDYHNGTHLYQNQTNTYQEEVALSREHQLFWVDLQLGKGETLVAVDDWPVTMEVDVDVKVSQMCISSIQCVYTLFVYFWYTSILRVSVLLTFASLPVACHASRAKPGSERETGGARSHAFSTTEKRLLRRTATDTHPEAFCVLLARITEDVLRIFWRPTTGV